MPSTKTIFIAPSATSSTPRRSIAPHRATGGPARISGVRRPGRGGRARVPLRVEQLAQPVAGGLERHARDDRLEEAEDDELARLVGRDPAALEVEELGLVDRADRRRVGGAPAVGLVDLERRDRDRARRLREVHPELAEEAVGPDRGLLDRDQALHVAARAASSSAPFESRLPVVSRPMWRVYEVRSNSWSVGAEHDLDLLDRAAVALEPVVDAAADEPRRRAGRAPSGASRPRRSRPGGAGTRPGRRPGPGCTPCASVGAARREGPRRAGEERLRLAASARSRPDRTSSSTSDAEAPSPSSTIVRVRSARPRRPDGPAEDDRAARGARRPARGRRRPGSSAARVSWASLSSAGSVAARRRGAGRARPRRGRPGAPSVSRMTPARGPRRSGRAPRRGPRVDATSAARPSRRRRRRPPRPARRPARRHGRTSSSVGASRRST